MRISRPRFAPSLPIVALLVAAAMLAAGGCADGFVPEARSINPYVRRQWEADEKKGPTYYTRVEVLRKVRTTAHRMPPEEHQRLAKEIADVLEIEKSGTMRAELVRTLAVLPCPTALIALEAASTDNDADVRAAACQALAGQQGPEAVKMLAQ